MADNAQVDAITGKAVRMDGEMVNVSTNTGTGAIGLQTWEAAHTKRVVQWGLPCCCCATTATEAELLEEATINRWGWRKEFLASDEYRDWRTKSALIRGHEKLEKVRRQSLLDPFVLKFFKLLQVFSPLLCFAAFSSDASKETAKKNNNIR